MSQLLPVPILPIIRMGHPTLRRIADGVPLPVANEVRELARHMVATMLEAPGVGLAAPQVGASLRLIVYRVPPGRIGDDEPTEPRGPQVLINPVLTPLADGCEVAPEGCLSIPGLRGDVPRFRHIRYDGYNLEGEAVAGEAHGFHARVLQHEVDHLDGVLYLDRMTDMTSLGFVDVMMERAQQADQNDGKDHDDGKPD